MNKRSINLTRMSADHGLRSRLFGVAGAMLLASMVGCASHPAPASISIGEALAVPDDNEVVITAQVVQQVDGDHYLLRDSSGSITADIDEDLLGKVKIAPDARIRVGGKVDQDHKPPLLKAKTVQLVQ